MQRQHYETRPADSETVRFVGIMVTIFRFNIEEVEDGYDCDEVEYTHKEPLTESDYAPMVSTLVRGKYSADAVEAIQLNYINDPEGGKSEMDALQEWRAVAKDAARKAISAS